MKIKGHKNKEVRNPGLIAEIFQAILKAENEIDQDKEHFWAVGLDVRNRIKYIELVSLGTLNASLVHPREVFRMAIFEATGSIMVIHNHPSGCLDPSDDDLSIVKRLIDAGKIIEINVLDSLIIGEEDYFSWKEKGLM
jgi:DNA repair protein RadC